jgi:hypothetical protein
MYKDLVVLALHGMGVVKPSFAEGLRRGLRDGLGAAAWWRVRFEPVQYQPELQEDQAQVFGRMTKVGVEWLELRRFMLYSFSDAAVLDYRKEAPNSAYERVQRRIVDALDACWQQIGREVPVVVVAQSLGGHVVSNYLWDAQSPHPPAAGVWKSAPGSVAAADPAKDRFLRLRSTARLITTGCNIPLFVSGLSPIRPIDPPNPGFAWINLYDKDDPLGWPLRPLGPLYRAAVEDQEIAVGASWLKRLTTGQTPFGHGEYWETPEVIERIVAEIDGLLATA